MYSVYRVENGTLTPVAGFAFLPPAEEYADQLNTDETDPNRHYIAATA